MPMKSIVVVWDGVQCTMDPAFTPPPAFEEVWTGSRGPGQRYCGTIAAINTGTTVQSVPTLAVKARRESGKSPPARGVPTKLVEVADI